MGAKPRLDLGLLLIALSAPLKCVAVSQVISGMQIVAPRGWSLGSHHAGENESNDNRSEEWASATQLFLALDEEASEVL
jgi:hypothetical protein